jgi:threonine dehydrogenase-like Zn-dependent dehydrogenase
MKAVTWQGKRTIEVKQVPDPVIQEPTDIIIKVTSSCICGSDLHLYEVMAPVMEKGDIMGHEPIGIVQEVGSAVKNLDVGDRVVVPFNISCGHCFMCKSGLQSQCETTQVKEYGRGAALFGYTKLYGHVPGGQAEYLRVPHADYGAIKLPEGPSDDRFIYLSDVLPTAWQAVQYADVKPGSTVAVLGLGPIGDMAARIARYKGANVIGIDQVPERLARVKQFGVESVIDFSKHDDNLVDYVRDMTDGRGPDAVIEAVGLEAHGSAFEKFAQDVTGLMPKALSAPMLQKGGVDRLNALYTAFDMVRRGGTVSISGVYAGNMDIIPMDTLFDKQLTLRMGQANVRRWTDEILPLLVDEDPLGVDGFASHHLSIDDAALAYEKFQKKEDGFIKVILHP